MSITRKEYRAKKAEFKKAFKENMSSLDKAIPGNDDEGMDEAAFQKWTRERFVDAMRLYFTMDYDNQLSILELGKGIREIEMVLKVHRKQIDELVTQFVLFQQLVLAAFEKTRMIDLPMRKKIDKICVGS